MIDHIDLKQAQFHSRNVSDWPVVTSLTGVEFRDADPAGGVRPIADIPWPDVTPQGWDGPITHCIWLGRQINGVWHIACALEFYRGKVWTGAPLHRQYNDWFSIGKGFGELEGLPNVQIGEKIAFMLTPGSQRLKDTSTQPGQKSRQERSNVIVVTFNPNAIVQADPVKLPPLTEPQAPSPSVPTVPVPLVSGLLEDVIKLIQAQAVQLSNLERKIDEIQPPTFPEYSGRLQVGRLAWPLDRVNIDAPIILTPRQK